METRSRFVTFLIVLGSLGVPAAANPNFEVVVNPQLYAGGEIDAGLQQYLRDVRAQGYNPILTTTDFADADALRSHLANRYANDGLAGAVLIGDIPLKTCELDADYSHNETFACDLYYMELDGTWSDTDGNGVPDEVTGSVAPDIFVGRLMSHTLTTLHPGRTEAGLLNDYFQKNHDYRMLRLNQPHNGLSYASHDFPSWATYVGYSMDYGVDGSVEAMSDPDQATDVNYGQRLEEGWEHVAVIAHSCSQYHQFQAEEGSDSRFYNLELEDLDDNALFYNLIACHNSNTFSPNYMGGEYIFGTDTGLASMGSTKLETLHNYYEYYLAMGQGETVGEAFKLFLDANRRGEPMVYESYLCGMMINGDPLLTGQSFRIAPSAGDADHDGDIDATDLAWLGTGWNPSGSGNIWEDGDFDGDGDVDATDLATLGMNWAPDGVAIPEPASMGLMGLGCLALLRRRVR